MSIKLYNKTQCPDEILRSIITAAGRRIGARTGIVVKVTQARGRGFKGYATRSWWVYSWHLGRKRTKGHGRSIRTDGGWIGIQLPCPFYGSDPLGQAEGFYRLCLHEWAHIRDFQQGKRFGDYNLRHDNRPHEIRADCAAREGLETYYSPTAEKAVLALAVWLEGQ